MPNIIPKLNLNKTPSLVEANSLIFAKNIRLDVDNTIHKDYSIWTLSIPFDSDKNSYVKYDNIFDRIKHDILNSDKSNNSNVSFKLDELYDESGKLKVVGVISSNNSFYLFVVNHVEDEIKSSAVIKYDEDDKLFSICECNWNWSKGVITGTVITNLKNETVITICESKGVKLVPIKSINLNYSTFKDDETIYTQTPNIPITNINQTGYFDYKIPNGVYQFFVRYKIRNNFYTNWFPASKEMFAGNSQISITSFGTVKYINTHKSSDTSFKFKIEHLCDEYKKNYESFQIGFIASSDGEITGRGWKHFKFEEEDILFTYKAEDSEEIPVIDFLSQTYQIYDVENITSFKNKLYISNYKESDFNEDRLASLASDIQVSIGIKANKKGYDEYDVQTTNVNGVTAISNINVEGAYKSISGNDTSIIHGLLTTGIVNGHSIENLLNDSFKDNKINIGSHKDEDFLENTKYYISAKCTREKLSYAKDRAITAIKKKYNYGKDKPWFTIHTETSGNKVEYVTINDNKIELDATSNTYKADVTELINNFINEKRYINTNGTIIDADGKVNTFTNISIHRKFKVSWLTQINPDNPVLGPNDKIIEEYFDYAQNITIKLTADSSKVNIGDDDFNFVVKHTTLIPYQKYKFFCHFVKQSGEVTNGYACKNEITCPYNDHADNIIYPIFSSINIPEGYVSCFFSILHTEIESSTVYNFEKVNDIIEGSCIDINLGNFKGTRQLTLKQTIEDESNDKPSVDPDDPSIITPNIPIITDKDTGTIVYPKLNVNSKQYGKSTAESETKAVIGRFKEITTKGEFYYSADNTSTRYFGSDGVLVIRKEEAVDKLNTDAFAYNIIDYKISESDDIQLVKCTPYVKNTGENIKYDIFSNMNLLGYICEIYPLIKNKTIKYYTDGSSCFKKEYIDVGSNPTLSLKELNKYLGGVAEEDRLTAMKLENSNSIKIYSNYNLNYLAISEEPTPGYKTVYNKNENAPSGDNTNDSEHTLIIRLFSSLNMTFVYESIKWYNTYTRKTYFKYNKNDVTEFNNTIRSSIITEDESNINIFKFDPNDYYNVPTDKGKIINLIAVGESILCHTRDSIFRFSGSNNLSSSDGDIQITESTPFDNGITEMFGSEFGFAGLYSKEDTIITETGYIFFDRDSNIIYLYEGNNQLTKITDGIEKLVRHRPIRNINFANDYYNNRFFVNIVFVENDVEYPVTLSFSLNKDNKNFVSVHDFHFNKSFNTKTNCYFFSDNKEDINYINKDINLVGYYYGLDSDIDKIYINHLKEGNINVVDSENNPVTISLNRYSSIIDIINNYDYETIKTVNAISWIGNIVDSEYKEIDKNDINSLKLAETINNKYPCTALRLYTDTCITKLFNFDKISNGLDSTNKPISIYDTDSYVYPRYNQGKWTFNYFRNIDNVDKTADYQYDQHSLVEGKYFVVRFIYDREFKLETLSINYNNKL